LATKRRAPIWKRHRLAAIFYGIAAIAMTIAAVIIRPADAPAWWVFVALSVVIAGVHVVEAKRALNDLRERETGKAPSRR
jgi:sirohydrochlorin ferrochelatase